MSEDQALQDARDGLPIIATAFSILMKTPSPCFLARPAINWWQDKDVSDNQLREIWDMMKFGSTQLQHATGASDLHPFRKPRRG